MTSKVLPRDLNCFICGRDNPMGLKLHFRPIDKHGASAKFRPQVHLNGYKGMLHGGIISAVLDEAMYWALYNSNEKLYVTSQLTVNFKKPVPVEDELEVIGYSVKHEDGRTRKIENAKAELVNSKGDILATAEGKFFQIPPQDAQELLKTFAHC
jgi:uncharacterized protein (TIGR00369 family)